MSEPQKTSWRDPLDWPFLLGGVVIRAWCALYEEFHRDENKHARRSALASPE